MKLNAISALLSLAAGLSFTAAHAQSMDGMKGMDKPASVPAAANVMTDAVVQKVDPAKSEIVLKHGEIENLGMPAMTMGFGVTNTKMLDGVKAGDKVRFHAEMMKGRPTVTRLDMAH